MTEQRERANAYELEQSRGRRIVTTAIAAIGLVVCAVAGIFAEAPTLWGVVPIALYAILCLLGMDLVIATVVSLVGGVRFARPRCARPALRGGAVSMIRSQARSSRGRHLRSSGSCSATRWAIWSRRSA